MPQKANPISSELIIGASGVAGALASALARIQEAGHERAAGEWQIEWHAIPQLAAFAGGTLAKACEIVDGLRVDADRMRANLELDSGLVMAGAQMFQLAAVVGREAADDLVYEAATRARASRRELSDALRQVAQENDLAHLLPDPLVAATDYLGEASHTCEFAVQQWRNAPAYELPETIPLAALATELPNTPA